MSNSEDDSISSVKPQADKPQTDKPQKVDESRLTTAFHEAGHAVMAQIVGRPIEKVTARRPLPSRWLQHYLFFRFKIV